MAERSIRRSALPGPALAPSSAAGFSLLEVAIALAILSVALLLGMSLLLGQARYVHRLDADRAARGALAGALEAIRSGAVPISPGHFASPSLAGELGGAPDGMTLEVDVTAAAGGPPGLYEVALRAHYLVAGAPAERRLASMVWQPAAAAP